MPTFIKDPGAILDYTFDWSDWMADGDAIDTVDIDEGGLTLDQTSSSDTGVTVWLSGGTAGTIYPVRCRITTTDGRTDDRTIHFRIKER